MIEIGKINNLVINRESPVGLYLADEAGDEVLLPNRYVKPDYKQGDQLEVFIYCDSEDRPVAVTETPKLLINEFALLKVKEVTKIGAFVDWGLSKDLLVPYSEQRVKMEEGKSYVVYLYLDQKTNRLVGTTRLSNFLQQVFIQIEEGDEVDLFIFEETDLGFKAVVNEEHEGLLYKNEVFQPVSVGDSLKGYVKKIRPDNKIDLMLDKKGGDEIDQLASAVLEKLNDNDGYLAVSDKSDPETIKSMFHVSKKMFKKAIGNLYRNQKITIDKSGIKTT